MREIRLPRALLAVMVGVSLGLSGAALQGYLRNPLAEPGLAPASPEPIPPFNPDPRAGDVEVIESEGEGAEMTGTFLSRRTLLGDPTSLASDPVNTS